jgi:uncharacterized cupin superfamily protein
VWKLEMRRRDLDSNIIRLHPGASIGAHVGPDLDVLLLVLDGTGQLTTELNTIDLHPGALIWLPQHSRRQFTAGSQGLSYLTVHQRRQSLTLNAAPPHQQRIGNEDPGAHQERDGPTDPATTLSRGALAVNQTGQAS